MVDKKKRKGTTTDVEIILPDKLPQHKVPSADKSVSLRQSVEEGVVPIVQDTLLHASAGLKKAYNDIEREKDRQSEKHPTAVSIGGVLGEPLANFFSKKKGKDKR